MWVYEVGLSRLGAKRHTIVIGIGNRKDFQGEVVRVKFIGNGGIGIVLGTPLESPVRCRVVKCGVSLHHRRTSGVRIVNRSRTGRLLTNKRSLPTVSTSRSCLRERVASLTRRHQGAVEITLINGPGYKGASLFGVTSNDRRRIKGCDKIAISTGRKIFRRNNCHFLLISLPNACSLSTCDPRRLCIHEGLVRSVPSIIIGIISTSGLREGLCLAARLVSVGLEIMVTLGVCSRLRTGNSELSVGRLKCVLNVPVIPAIDHDKRKVGRLFSAIIRVCRGDSPRLSHRVRVGRKTRLRRAVSHVGLLLRGGASLECGCSAHCLTVGCVRGSERVRTIIRDLPGESRVVTTHFRRRGEVSNLVGSNLRSTLISTGCTFIQNTLTRACRPCGNGGGHRALASGVSSIIAGH